MRTFILQYTISLLFISCTLFNVSMMNVLLRLLSNISQSHKDWKIYLSSPDLDIKIPTTTHCDCSQVITRQCNSSDRKLTVLPGIYFQMLCGSPTSSLKISRQKYLTLLDYQMGAEQNRTAPERKVWHISSSENNNGVYKIPSISLSVHQFEPK